MRRLVLAAFAALLVCPTASLAQGAAEDSVTGSGTARDVGIDDHYSFAFDAHSGPSGENPSGTAGVWVTSFPAVGVRGSVTCLAVQGKRAIIGIANDAESVFPGGTLFEVTEGSDTLTVSFVDPAPTDCSSGVNRLTYPVTSGDITITDALAVPATKHQCKNGGWRNFPGFKNQGDCVSFVATGGRNQPANPPT